MDETTRQKLLAKNQRIIDMVVERAKRDFPEDIAIIGLTGSFSTGDYHEKSDLDLIIINNTPEGWGISYCFILEDVGYDIYCTPWETRIQAAADLESAHISHLVDLQILYCAKPEYMERFQALRQKALDGLSKPIGRECLARARRWLDLARQEYAGAMLAGETGPARYAAGRCLCNVVNAVVSMNNTYITRGTRRYLSLLLSYSHLPEDFGERYMAVIRAKTLEEIQSAAHALLKGAEALYASMWDTFVEKPTPTPENLMGTYEELWCNYRNKMIHSAVLDEADYAYHVAVGAQEFLDAMAAELGVGKFDLMADFDPDHLARSRDALLRAMEAYKAEYDRVGLGVARHETVDELYRAYCKRK